MTPSSKLFWLTWLAYAAIAVGVIALFHAAGKEDRESWRYCRRCGRWFNCAGKIVDRVPLGRQLGAGVCGECYEVWCEEQFGPAQKSK